MKVEVNDFEAGTMEEVVLERGELDALGEKARNLGRVYRALARGDVNCGFEEVVERHEFIAEILRKNEYFEG